MNDEGKEISNNKTCRYDGKDCSDMMPIKKGLSQPDLCHDVLNLYVKNGKECLNRTGKAAHSFLFYLTSSTSQPFVSVNLNL